MQNRRHDPARQPPQPSGRAPSLRQGGVPQRRCATCRTPRPTLGLVQLRPGSTAGGRHSYVCIALPCLRAALTGGRRGGGAAALAAAVEQARAMAAARLLALVGLAQRCGILVAGVEATLALCAASAAGAEGECTAAPAVLVAHDLSSRSGARLPQVPAVFSAEELGQAAGRPPTGAMGIRPGRLAMQAAYWLRVWYATQHQRETV